MAKPNVYAHVSKNGKTYYLNSKFVKLRSKQQHLIYYFSGYIKEETACALPAGWEVKESSNGLPYAKKVAK